MIHIYVTRTCPYCRSAERLLDRLGLSYESTDLTADPEARRRIVAETGWRTVPVILINGRLVGGYDDLRRLHERGELSSWLEEDAVTGG